MLIRRLEPAILVLAKSRSVSRRDAEQLSSTPNTVSAELKRLHTLGTLRIAYWYRTRGRPMPAYKLAEGKPDYPRPKPLSNRDRAAKRRQDPEVRDVTAAKRRAKRRQDKHRRAAPDLSLAGQYAVVLKELAAQQA